MPIDMVHTGAGLQVRCIVAGIGVRYPDHREEGSPNRSTLVSDPDYMIVLVQFMNQAMPQVQALADMGLVPYADGRWNGVNYIRRVPEEGEP